MTTGGTQAISEADPLARESEAAPAFTAPPYPSPAVGWIAVAVLFTLSMVTVLDRNIVTLLVGPIKAHFGASDIQMGLLLGAAFAVPHGLFGIPVGWAVDRFQRRTVIAIGVATWSIATLATGIARGFDWLIVARCGVGAGDAALVPGQSSLLSDLFPREKLGLPLSVANMGFKAGQGMALIIGGALTVYIAPTVLFDVPLLGAILGWQLIFILVGLVGLLFIPLIFMMREPARQALAHRSTAAEGSFKAYFAFVTERWRFFLPHHVGLLLLVSLSYTILSWTPAFLLRVHHWPESVAGAWLGTAFLAGPLIGMPIHGAIADHLLRKGWSDIHMRYPMIAAIVAAPFGIATYLVPSPELAVIMAGLFVFIISGYVGLPLAAVLGVMPSRLRGKAASVALVVCSTTGAVFGPLIVGILTDDVFGNPAKVGSSIIAAIAIQLPMVILLFWATLKPLRELAMMQP